jgi:hypothetical protein
MDDLYISASSALEEVDHGQDADDQESHRGSNSGTSRLAGGGDAGAGAIVPGADASVAGLTTRDAEVAGRPGTTRAAVTVAGASVDLISSQKTSVRMENCMLVFDAKNGFLAGAVGRKTTSKGDVQPLP